MLLIDSRCVYLVTPSLDENMSKTGYEGNEVEMMYARDRSYKNYTNEK